MYCFRSNRKNKHQLWPEALNPLPEIYFRLDDYPSNCLVQKLLNPSITLHLKEIAIQKNKIDCNNKKRE